MKEEEFFIIFWVENFIFFTLLNNKWYRYPGINIIIPVRYAPGTGTVFYFDGTGRYGGSGVKSKILPWRSVAVVGRSSFLECFKNKKCI